MSHHSSISIIVILILICFVGPSAGKNQVQLYETQYKNVYNYSLRYDLPKDHVYKEYASKRDKISFWVNRIIEKDREEVILKVEIYNWEKYNGDCENTLKDLIEEEPGAKKDSGPDCNYIIDGWTGIKGIGHFENQDEKLRKPISVAKFEMPTDYDSSRKVQIVIKSWLSEKDAPRLFGNFHISKEGNR